MCKRKPGEIDWFKITESWKVWLKLGPEQWIGILTMEVELGKTNSTVIIIRRAMELRRERIGGEREEGKKRRGWWERKEEKITSTINNFGMWERLLAIPNYLVFPFFHSNCNFNYAHIWLVWRVHC